MVQRQFPMLLNVGEILSQPSPIMIGCSCHVFGRWSSEMCWSEMAPKLLSHPDAHQTLAQIDLTWMGSLCSINVTWSVFLKIQFVVQQWSISTADLLGCSEKITTGLPLWKPCFNTLQTSLAPICKMSAHLSVKGCFLHVKDTASKPSPPQKSHKSQPAGTV